MSSIPLQDNEIDAIVFSLSLMGSNYLDYIKEAFRVVKPYGNLFVCEPKKKVEKRLEALKILWILCYLHQTHYVLCYRDYYNFGQQKINVAFNMFLEKCSFF